MEGTSEGLWSVKSGLALKLRKVAQVHLTSYRQASARAGSDQLLSGRKAKRFKHLRKPDGFLSSPGAISPGWIGGSSAEGHGRWKLSFLVPKSNTHNTLPCSGGGGGADGGGEIKAKINWPAKSSNCKTDAKG